MARSRDFWAWHLFLCRRAACAGRLLRSAPPAHTPFLSDASAVRTAPPWSSQTPGGCLSKMFHGLSDAGYTAACWPAPRSAPAVPRPGWPDLHANADLPVVPGHGVPVRFHFRSPHFNCLEQNCLGPYIFIAQRSLHVKFKSAIFNKKLY